MVVETEPPVDFFRRTGGLWPQNVNVAIKRETLWNFLETWGIPYSTGILATPISSTEVAEAAGKWTVLVGCWK
jgi:hypothetical protein